jgi:hypothetical protein
MHTRVRLASGCTLSSQPLDASQGPASIKVGALVVILPLYADRTSLARKQLS